MNSFLIFQKNNNSLTFVKDGFNWSFFLFGTIWCAINRMWLSAAGLILLDFILIILYSHSYPIGVLISVKLLLSILLAFYINDIYGLGLEQQGYQLKNLVFASSKEEAELRYLDKLNRGA